MFFEPHWSPIWRQHSFSPAFKTCCGTKQESIGAATNASNATIAVNFRPSLIIIHSTPARYWTQESRKGDRRIESFPFSVASSLEPPWLHQVDFELNST